MDTKLVEKIFNYLNKVENNLPAQPLGNNKKIASLLIKKKGYDEIMLSQKEYQELTKQANQEEEKKLFQDEVEELEKQKKKIISQIKEILIKEPGTGENILVEIRPGTGGTEAGLFARDLYRMYVKFAEKMGWKLEMVETKVDFAGNFTFVSFLVKGREVFNWLKNEAGIHRVQRVPATENKGRIHTSTASVVVLPEIPNITLSIHPHELRIDTYRSSGAGGQHVNTTDSAVRVTHLPTGIVATSQDGRSQHDNKEKALFILRSRLFEKYRQDQAKEIGDLRSSMIGTAERAEKIRTYNFPQNRVTDHRLGISWNKLNFIIEGDLEELCQKLTDYEVEKCLSKLASETE